MSLPDSEKASSGFTAVNGDAHAISSFRPAEATKPWRALSGKSSPGENITVSTSLPSHGWRPDIREVTANREDSNPSVDPASKRKRPENEDDAQSNNVDADGRESPKRRLLSNVLDSAVDLTSPDVEIDRIRPGLGQTSRASSPVPNLNRAPPPEVSSSAEARLMESARQFQQAQRAETAEKASPARDNYEMYDQSPPDDTTMNDGTDPKKRKRLFTNRTKSGCHTCRSRKKKCDEKKPICGNCERGRFDCGGYGTKPPKDYKPTTQSRTVMPQPKPPLQPSAGSYTDSAYVGPPSYWPQGEPPKSHPQHHSQSEIGRSYSHWGRLPDQASEAKPPSSRDSWPHPGWHTDHPPPPLPPPGSYYPERTPTSEYPILPPPNHIASTTPQPHMPLPPLQHSQPPPLAEPWAHQQHGYASHRYPPPPPSHVSSNNTHPSSSSHGSGRGRHHLSEKDKMLRGMPYLQYFDQQLIRERERCAQACLRYNKAAKPDGGISASQRAVFFSQILDPRESKDFVGPAGDIGSGTIVESPFKCDYGYHIHLGNDTIISMECYLQDGGGVFIGNRVVIGARVQLLTSTTSVDARVRAGGDGPGTRVTVKSGSIWVGDDTFIGAGAIVLPYVRIGNGAVVGAGSVVTRDVPDNTVVAGNPAKHIRTIDANADHHHSRELDAQEEKARRIMEDYVDCGFQPRTPRMI
ncbi:uncharacterized protein LTR77_004199 [Saxophila tyrrhenica]|uniref:Zn(2)-C6 fungal-type domain-containing protein n=1 Tax=Saxophila tyrrhenica TaxID=1690608 RepID=A0AAV9PF83_9PEZI|nr:hypothetical protein LTR77_004199 [Saxophila tyrrhenica]